MGSHRRVSAYHGFCRGSDCLILPTWNHLWFVAYPWVYTVMLYVIVRAIPKATPWLRSALERTCGGAGVLIWPIALLAIARVTMIDTFPPNHAPVGDWYNHVTYGMTFLLGFALAGTLQPWLALERMRWTAFVLAISGWAFLIAYMSVYGADNSPEPPHLLMLFRRVVFGAEQWLAIAAVLGFARRYLNHDNAPRRYLTTAIFPVYILHQTIIVVVAHALKPVDLLPAIEAPLLIVITAAACLAGYETVRRVTLLRPLFGLPATRTDTPAPTIATRESGSIGPRPVPQDVQ